MALTGPLLSLMPWCHPWVRGHHSVLLHHERGRNPRGCRRLCLPMCSRWPFLSHVFSWKESCCLFVSLSEKWGTGLLLSDPTSLPRILLLFMQGMWPLSLGCINMYAFVSSLPLHPSPRDSILTWMDEDQEQCRLTFICILQNLSHLCMNLLHSPKY